MRTRKGFMTVQGAMLALAMMLIPVYYGACATVQTGGWGSDPIPAMTASVMSAKPCSPPAFRDPSPNVNRQNGWFSTVPAGSDLPACGKAETPYYCQNRAGCGEFTVGMRFVGGGKTPRHAFVDVLTGDIMACLQPAQRFGVGSLECERKHYSAANGPIRVVLESQLAGADSSTELAAFISALPGAPVAIGQIGPVEPR
jgi:hypothetical protein